MNMEKISDYYKFLDIDFEMKQYDTEAIRTVDVAIRFTEHLDPAKIVCDHGVRLMRVLIESPRVFKCFRPDMTPEEHTIHVARGIVHNAVHFERQMHNYMIGSIFSNFGNQSEPISKHFLEKLIDETLLLKDGVVAGKVFGIYAQTLPNNYKDIIIPYIVGRKDIDEFIDLIHDKNALGDFCLQHGLIGFADRLPNLHKGKFLEAELGL